MQMTDEQLASYERDGFIFLQDYFSPAEIAVTKAELPNVFGEDSPRRVIEKGGDIVRSVYGSHMTNEVFRRLSRHPRLVGPARQLLGSEVYVYQFKINAKSAFGGDVWEWHQDYVFWRNEDGMPTSRVVNVIIYLDDVTEFNGPLLLIPGSHSQGVIDVQPQDDKNLRAGETSPYRDSPAWISNLTTSLKYALTKETVAASVAEHGIISAKGIAGSAMFFHGNLVHASTNNISPFDRAVVILTYNSLENIPVPRKTPRPDFLVGRDHTPLTPLEDDTLLTCCPVGR